MKRKDGRTIRIQPVTENNYSAILKLKISKEQQGFIESTAQCLEEANQLSLWHPVGVYADETLIGFAMYGLWKNEGIGGRVWLDRFLVDKEFQGQGLGKFALNALIQKIGKEYNCEEIFLSIYKENMVAIQLYEKAGFCFNGEVDQNGEKLMVLKLTK